MLTVKEYETIRRLVMVDGLSQREVAQQLNHSRKTIRKAIAHSEPPGYQRKQPCACPVMGPFIEIIDAWLEADKDAPRKQRHTGQRIFDRLCEEYGFTGSVSAVRRYLAENKRHKKEVFFPLAFKPGEEAQVDWGEAKAWIGGSLVTVYLFCMRLCHSKVVFVRAYSHMRSEAFLDGHVRALEFFGGVPLRIAYDNLKTAVISVGRGGKRVLNDRFIGFRSHYLFETRFCNVRAGWEKGIVENLVKHAQRTFMTPVPVMIDLEALNVHLGSECLRYLQNPKRKEKLKAEQAAFFTLPAPYEACVRASTYADKRLMVQADKCFYSVPMEYAHHSIQYKLFVDRIEIFSEAKQIAAHHRADEPGTRVLEPWHYVPLLARKPGGIHNGEPFQGDAFGPEFGRLRQELELRYDPQGTERFIRVLLLTQNHPLAEVQAAVKYCVGKNIFSVEAVEAELRSCIPTPKKVASLDNHPQLKTSVSGIRPANIYDITFRKREAQA